MLILASEAGISCYQAFGINKNTQEIKADNMVIIISRNLELQHQAEKPLAGPM